MRRRTIITVLGLGWTFLLVIWLLGHGDFVDVRKGDARAERRGDATVSSWAESRRHEVILPRLDHEALLAKAKKERKGGRYQFAQARAVRIAPETHGEWQISGDEARWGVDIRSEGAESLNFGFREFHLPPGGSLVLRRPDSVEPDLTFTSRDNDSHGELWTPIIRGERVRMELTIPKILGAQLRLALTSINHGFRKASDENRKAIGDSASGTCNVDVACSSNDDTTFGPVIDLYRDQIRAVAAYTVNGTETCSGALINNVKNDQRPFFLTAEHCGLDSGNSPSVVAYWNFENSECRVPGGVASGLGGDGPISQFNTGAIFRASFAGSDFCLIEFDDAVDPQVDPFYAGWDRGGENAAMAVGIHHPSVSEKRIALEGDPITTTEGRSNLQVSDGPYFRVSDWDFGTTDGGSSGSPLFDQNGRIIGQLTGGEAACGNDLSDWYGRMARSWVGDGSQSGALQDWLDPEGVGATFIDGINSDEQVSISDAVVMEGDAGTQVVNLTVSLSEAAGEEVSARLIAVDGSANAGEDFEEFDEVVVFEVGETSQVISVLVIGDDEPEEHEEFRVQITEVTNALGSEGGGRITILNNDYNTPVITSEDLVGLPVQTQLSYQIRAIHNPTSYRIENAPSGMTVDAVTGVVLWEAPQEGIFTFDVIAVNPAGEGRITVEAEVTPNSLAEGADLVRGVFLTNESPGWALTTEVTHDGIDSVRGEEIDDLQSAAFRININGPDTLSFWWKVDSEEDFDFLRFTVDGAEVAAISGDRDWARVEVAIPEGSHVAEWAYSKDDTVSNGRDTGWVDEISLTSLSGAALITSPLVIDLEEGDDFDYAITSDRTDLIFEVEDLPGGFTFDGTNQISATDLTAGFYAMTLVVTDAEGDSRTASLQVIVGEDYNVGAGTSGLDWSSSGERPWLVEGGANRLGEAALRSGNINRGASSSIHLEVTGPEFVSFWWANESEESIDTLSFEVDGRVIERISGGQDWRQVFYEVPAGEHRLSWVFRKSNVSNNLDNGGLLSEVEIREDFLPGVTALIPTSIKVGEALSIPLRLWNGPGDVSISSLPPWLSANGEGTLLSGTPPSAGTFAFEVRTENESGSRDQEFQVVVDPARAVTLAALDTGNVRMQQDESRPWITVEDEAAFGGSALRSSLLNDDESSIITFVVKGPGFFVVDWRVSSEFEFDGFVSFLNNNYVDAITGEVGWRTLRIPLPPGLNAVFFEYLKDDLVSSGEDAGFLDRVRLEGFAEYVRSSERDALAVSYEEDLDGDGFGLFENYAFGLDLTNGLPGNSAIDWLADGSVNLELVAPSERSDVAYRVFRNLNLREGNWRDTNEILAELPGGGVFSRYQGSFRDDGFGKAFYKFVPFPRTPEE